jgi:hypothetical protein
MISAAGEAIAGRPPTGAAVSPLFRRGNETSASDTEALARYEHLRGLSPTALAALLLPGLGPDGVAHASGGVAPQVLCNWLLVDTPGAAKFNPLQLLLPVREALQQLEHASLVTMSGRDRATIWRITALGETTLTDGSLATRLPG